MVRKVIKATSDLFMTVGTVNRIDIPTRGVFSKGRTHVLDKLILCSVSRYFFLKFYVFGFRIGKFLYGGSMGFLKYVNLLADESDTLAKDLVALNRRESSNSVLKRSDK